MGLVILIVAILFQCGAQPANHWIWRVYQSQQPAFDWTTHISISVWKSYGIGKLLLQYKGDNWFFSYQQEDLEVHMATLWNSYFTLSVD